MLKEKFGFPEYYGRNLSALWDCLDGLFYEKGEYEVKIYGYNSLTKDVKEYCGKILEIFEDVHKRTPNVTFEVIS